MLIIFFVTQNLKQEMRTLENLQSEHSSSKRRQDMDPDRMLDRIRKLEFGKDLAEQRCDKFQVRIKQLEGVYRRQMCV